MTLMSKQGFGLSRAGLKQLSLHKTEWINEATNTLSLSCKGDQYTPLSSQGPFCMSTQSLLRNISGKSP